MDNGDYWRRSRIRAHGSNHAADTIRHHDVDIYLLHYSRGYAAPSSAVNSSKNTFKSVTAGFVILGSTETLQAS